jgi:hypothetical protein
MLTVPPRITGAMWRASLLFRRNVERPQMLAQRRFRALLVKKITLTIQSV